MNLRTMTLIENFEAHQQLGREDMDETHREFIDLLSHLLQAGDIDLCRLFPDFVDHIKRHFESESRLMVQVGFPATAEHEAEHLRVLGELDRFGKRLHYGRTAFLRAYLRDQLPSWFDLHLTTMDSALAHHLKVSM